MQNYVNQIIHADSMDILKQLPDKCIDLILTDPPYELNIHGGSGMGAFCERKLIKTLRKYGKELKRK